MLAEEESGITWETVLPPISIKPEVLFELGPLAFTNSMLYTLIVIAALTLFGILVTRRMSLVPRGIQNFGEAIVEFLLALTEGTAGKRVGRVIFPLIATLFIFIITANYAGLLPGVGTVGVCVAEHHETTEGGEPHTMLPLTVASKEGAPIVALATPTAEGSEGDEPISTEGETTEGQQDEEAATGSLPTLHCPPGPGGEERHFVPFLRAPNADLNTTLAMALLAVGIVQIAGIRSHGVGGYLKELMTPIYLAPIHIIGEISRVISLSFRLFGNIFGGEVLVTVMFALLGSVFLGFGVFIFLGLEVLFGFIQAMIFSVLTLVFITTAVAGHGDHGGGHEPDEVHGPASELGHKVADVFTGGQSHKGEKIQGTEPKSGTERHLGG
jgi:F-type H+-transporting ATPase subunit a